MILKCVVLLVFAICISLITGKLQINYLRKIALGQQVRDDGPQRHLAKSGTPTFGGLIFLTPFFIYTIYSLITRGFTKETVLSIFVLLISAIGFADDYVKVKINKEGLSVRQKTVSILSIIVIFIIYLNRSGNLSGFYVPFFSKSFVSVSSFAAIVFALFAMFYFYSCINAVNITDGEDGLCTSISVIALLFIGTLASSSLFLHKDNELLEPTLVMIGGLLAFFFYNKYPAKIFMGDFGSLALGAYISGALFIIGQPWLFLLIGLIYWVEIASVFIQVMYFKKTGGKRIFRMSPIHHHFELGGWSENKICFVFSLVTALASVLALLASLR